MSYTIEQAVVKCATLGFTKVYVREGETRLVSVCQAWTPKGEMYVDLRIAYGKWRGESVGTIRREASK